MMSPNEPGASPDRRVLRQRLLARREEFATGAAAAAATEALARGLAALLERFEPHCLGTYVAMRSEFNPRLALEAARLARPHSAPWPLALPYCRREPREMHYRRWDGGALPGEDECRIPASDGALVVPDVVLAPCVGFTASGYRLGYGGGYFDRWLEAHPQSLAVGVAWATSEIAEAELAPRPHDRRLALVVTEQGLVRP
jgi:5,10-methenyltetrahydrofolate synthetase